MTEEPTLGEILRRLDDVSRQLIDLTREIKDDRAATAATYVRQDVYLAQRLADQSVVADLHGDIRTVKDERKKDNDWKRQQNLTLAGLTVTVLVSIALAIVNIVAR
jgi:hypothetical protein